MPNSKTSFSKECNYSTTKYHTLVYEILHYVITFIFVYSKFTYCYFLLNIYYISTCQIYYYISTCWNILFLNVDCVTKNFGKRWSTIDNFLWKIHFSFIFPKTCKNDITPAYPPFVKGTNTHILIKIKASGDIRFNYY